MQVPCSGTPSGTTIQGPREKTSGARHAFGSNSSDLFVLAQQIAGGPSRAAGLGHVVGKRFVAERYEYVDWSYLGQKDRNQLYNCSLVHPPNGGMN